MTGFLDRMPPALRHACIAFIGAFATVVLAAISGNIHDLAAIVWPNLLLDGVAAGVTAGLASVGVLASTPLTTQYGVGSGQGD